MSVVLRRAALVPGKPERKAFRASVGMKTLRIHDVRQIKRGPLKIEETPPDTQLWRTDEVSPFQKEGAAVSGSTQGLASMRGDPDRKYSSEKFMQFSVTIQ